MNLAVILHIVGRLLLIIALVLMMAVFWCCTLAWTLSVGMGMGDSPGVDHTATQAGIKALFEWMITATIVAVDLCVIIGLDIVFLDSFLKALKLPNVRQRCSLLLARYALFLGAAIWGTPVLNLLLKNIGLG